MNNPKRAKTEQQKTELNNRILEAWKKVPELRLGQLIDSAIWWKGLKIRPPLFYFEDEDLVEAIELYVTETTKKESK
jgi:hypothetical protein